MGTERVRKDVETSHEPDPCRNALIPERALHPLMHQTAVKNDRVTSANRFMAPEQFKKEQVASHEPVQVER